MAASSTAANMHMCSLHAASHTPLRLQRLGRAVRQSHRVSRQHRCAASQAETVDDRTVSTSVAGAVIVSSVTERTHIYVPVSHTVVETKPVMQQRAWRLHLYPQSHRRTSTCALLMLQAVMLRVTPGHNCGCCAPAARLWRCWGPSPPSSTAMRRWRRIPPT